MYPCDGNGDDAQSLRDTLADGTWIVALYSDDGTDQTMDYNGYELNFNSNGTVVAQNGSDTIEGTWSVTGTTDLDLVLDFGEEFPFDEFTDDWDVLDFTSIRVELEDVSGGDGSIDTLVFEKL